MATGELPYQKAVNCAKSQPALPCFLFGACNIVQYPLNFSPAEVGISDKAGFLADRIFKSLLTQLVAVPGGSAVLPYNGFMDQFAGFFVPHQGCFALIGDANGGNLFGFEFGFCNNLLGYRQLGLPYFITVMLNPSRFGIILLEFLLGYGYHGAMVVKDYGT
jgi:hypothetical protein